MSWSQRAQQAGLRKTPASVMTVRADSPLKRLGRLVVPASGFDPTAHLQELLRLLPGVMQPLPLRPVGVAGSVWLLGELYCLKQVPAHRRVAGLPTDAEHCESLLRKYPELLHDKGLAFPHSVIHLCTEDGDHACDLLISPALRGMHLSSFIARLDKSKPGDQQRLEKVCERIGNMLADFHRKYSDPETGEPECHRDFHPGNVLIDEASGSIGFVDLEGMGTWGPKDDVEKFSRLLRQLAGASFEAAFSRAYGAAGGLSPSARNSRKSLDLSNKTLLYPNGGTDSAPVSSGFRRANILLVPPSGFEPQSHLTVLAWLISPDQRIMKPCIHEEGHKTWVLSSGHDYERESWLLKLVPPGAGPSERERCEALAEKFPGLLEDRRLSLPFMVVPLQSGVEHVGDLLIYQKLPGDPLATCMESLQNDDDSNLVEVCRGVGGKQEKGTKSKALPLLSTPTWWLCSTNHDMDLEQDIGGDSSSDSECGDEDIMDGSCSFM